MTPETFTSLVNLGAAGAVIIVVVIFLKFQERREAEWQRFFTTLSAANEVDNRHICDALEKVVVGVNIISSEMRAHDEKVEDRIAAIQTATKKIVSHTIPKPAA